MESIFNDKLDTPAVIVLYDQAVSNVRSMVKGLKDAGIRHRPHIKVHKSVMLAKMQLDCGAEGITCAKISEAEAMVNGGIEDVLIANEVISENKILRLIELSRRSKLITCIDSYEGARRLSKAAQEAGCVLKIYLEINIGANRCGVEPENALALMEKVASLPGLDFIGLMTYDGRIYGKSKEQMPAEAFREAQSLIELQKQLKEHSFNLPVLSAGSSLSSRFPHELKGLTEARAGNYIFNDCSSLFSGLCTVDECALRVVSTIISIQGPDRLIIDAGSKTLTSDGCLYRPGYGYVVEYPEMEIYALNEEHGYVRYKDAHKLKIGQQISIIPNHACVVPNVNEEVFGLGNDNSLFVIPIEARGKNR